jgi:hypothetical protein
MKGVVFSEFIDMVEAQFSPAAADAMITTAGCANGGAYTAVGTYDHQELVRMVLALADASGTPVAELLRRFGQHLAGRFAQIYPAFFHGQPTLFDFLASIDAHIHVEVRKLYPDAELPSFEVLARADGEMTLGYRSSRHLADLAVGLAEGAACWYGDEVAIEQRPQPGGPLHLVIRRVGAAQAGHVLAH